MKREYANKKWRDGRHFNKGNSAPANVCALLWKAGFYSACARRPFAAVRPLAAADGGFVPGLRSAVEQGGAADA